MLTTTLQAIESILKTDPTISESEREQLICLLRDEGTEQKARRVLTRSQVAEMLGGKSLRFVDYIASQGKIRKVTIPGRTRSIGFDSRSVERLLDSENKK